MPACWSSEVVGPPDTYTCHVLPFDGSSLPTEKSSTPLTCSLRPLELSPCSTPLVSLPALSIVPITCLTILFPVFVPLFLLPSMKLFSYLARELLLILQSLSQHSLSQVPELNWSLPSLNFSGTLGFPATVLNTLDGPCQGLCLVHCWVLVSPQCLAP